MTLAICYFGLVRGFKFPEIAKSHSTQIFNKLKDLKIDFDVYIHTYNKQYDDSVKNIEHIEKLEIDNDQTIENMIVPLLNNVYCPNYWSNTHKINLFKCWYSQQKLREMLIQSHKHYDFVLILDIGQEILSPLDNILKLDPEYCYMPNFAFHEGLPVRLFLSNMQNALYYLDKFDFVLKDPDNIPNLCGKNQQRKKVGTKIPNIHPETGCKIYLIDIGKLKVKYLTIKFRRVRFDGKKEKD